MRFKLIFVVRHKTRLERLLQKNVGCSQIGAIKKERNAKKCAFLTNE